MTEPTHPWRTLRRIAPPLVWVLIALTAGTWLIGIGGTWLTWVLGIGGAFALGWLLTMRWSAPRTLGWAAALIFLATMAFPITALGHDLPLAQHGQRVQGTVTGYRQSEGPHSSTGYTEVHTDDGRYLQVTGDLDNSGPVTLLVDPTGTLAPQAADNVTVGADLAWSLTGTLIVLATVLAYGLRPNTETPQR